MKHFILLSIVFVCKQISFTQMPTRRIDAAQIPVKIVAPNHTLSKCKVKVWEGRKAEYKAEKIALASFTQKEFNSPDVELYERIIKEHEEWAMRYDGVWCKTGKMLKDTIHVYSVKDTIAYRKFQVIYHASQEKILEKGKEKTVKGICEDKITDQLIAGLNQKLLEEKILTELPDLNIPNWPYVYYVAIKQYQVKYGLAVGLLTQETVKHMKLSY
jgi:hypothetical protein